MTGRHLILCLVLILTLALPSSATGIPLITQLAPNSSISSILPIIGGTLIDSIPDANLYLVNVSQPPVLQTLSPLLGIQWVEANTGVGLGLVGQLGILQMAPSATADWYKYQPAMQLIRLPEAQLNSTGRGVVVADINSQFDYSHPALRGHLTSGYDFVTGKASGYAVLNQSSGSFMDQSSGSFMDQSAGSFMDGTPLLGMNPAYSHGTLCAGIIAAVAPDAMIMPLRTFDEQGGADLFVLAKAIRYAVTHGAAVINMSFGTLEDSKAIRSAINFAKQRGVTLVASAGNHNTSSPQYPAAYSGVISVAATDLRDVRGGFSNYAPYVSVSAPGVNIFSAYPGGLYSVVSGTSFSAPIVAAEAALLRSTQTNAVAAAAISSYTINIDAKNPDYVRQLGTGRVDVARAVRP